MKHLINYTVILCV